ncbi:unnamed protein product [Nezara viridula]|uniref:Uncharacterized protein n=1 Tax=Nezara viridula TaxID=85310 RepID=A0A9P0HGU8_NEZVI|nr:unnamed protein product [Nezara viridula]
MRVYFYVSGAVDFENDLHFKIRPPRFDLFEFFGFFYMRLHWFVKM